VISLYVNLRPDERGGDHFDAFVRNALHAVFATGASRPERASLDEQAGNTRRLLKRLCLRITRHAVRSPVDLCWRIQHNTVGQIQFLERREHTRANPLRTQGSRLAEAVARLTLKYPLIRRAWDRGERFQCKGG